MLAEEAAFPGGDSLDLTSSGESGCEARRARSGC